MPPAILGISLLALYLRTLAPGLTWANNGSDGGDLITAAATGGIPHPTGYPLYLILARLFQILPVGSLAFRTNLMSAFFTAFAALLIYGTVVRPLSNKAEIPDIFAGLAAGYCFGLAPLVWSQAVITEVYALQAFLVAGIIYLYSLPTPGTLPIQKALDRWRGLALGLALANHMTSLLLVPMALLLGSTHKQKGGQIFLTHSEQEWLPHYRFDLPSLGRQLLWLCAGLSLYLILPLRALIKPPVNWGNPVSLDGFWWIVSGSLYQAVFLQPRVSHLWVQAQAWMEFTRTQLGLLSVLLALFGLILYGEFSRLMLLSVWAALSSLAFTLFYRPADSGVYLMPLLVSFSIWLGLGTGRLSNWLENWSASLSGSASILILAVVLIRPLSYIHQVDASQDQQAEAFARQTLAATPQNAILFAEGDAAVFTLWYFHFALHERPDLVILAKDLLPYEWYQETVHTTYPSLSLPDSPMYTETIMRVNPQRTVCDIQYTDRAEFQCSMPLLDSR